MTTRVRLLNYHQVGDFPKRPARRSLYCHAARFTAQMEYLRQGGFHVLTMDEAAARLRGERALPERAVVLTFDDGYENFYTHAFPVLARHRYGAIVYVLSGLIGQTARWYARDGRDPPRLLGRDQIVELRRAGIEIGSHGVSHLKLAETESEQVREELVRSKSELEDLLGEEVRHFCYPYGSHNAAVVEAARAAGYATAVTNVRRAARRGDDLLALPRKVISHGDGRLKYAWKVRL
jgi:peptidoglycan/xylan/chitin deacetylase (PgdA/CDA1 family)